jgi:PIN domain nuclease of toxin-antitoxin system
MTYLLDTHALIWWVENNQTLSEAAKTAISDPRWPVFVSAASVWEISIKENSGKLRAPADLLAQIDSHGFEHLAITLSHAYAAGALPRHHDDPFDRMLVAQAIAEKLTIVTRDPRIAQYGIPTLMA